MVNQNMYSSKIFSAEETPEEEEEPYELQVANFYVASPDNLLMLRHIWLKGMTAAVQHMFIFLKLLAIQTSCHKCYL